LAGISDGDRESVALAVGGLAVVEASTGASSIGRCIKAAMIRRSSSRWRRSSSRRSVARASSARNWPTRASVASVALVAPRRVLSHCRVAGVARILPLALGRGRPVEAHLPADAGPLLAGELLALDALADGAGSDAARGGGLGHRQPGGRVVASHRVAVASRRRVVHADRTRGPASGSLTWRLHAAGMSRRDTPPTVYERLRSIIAGIGR
jgi:hypothetical protein